MHTLWGVDSPLFRTYFLFLQKIWSITFFASYVAVRYNGHPPHSGSWRCLMFNYCCAECNRIINRADSRFAPSQWEMALLCNDVFHWLGPRERERERLSLSAFLRTEDIEVHIVHISRLIITYTVKCRYNAVFGVQEIDRVIAVTAL